MLKQVPIIHTAVGACITDSQMTERASAMKRKPWSQTNRRAVHAV